MRLCCDSQLWNYSSLKYMILPITMRNLRVLRDICGKIESDINLDDNLNKNFLDDYFMDYNSENDTVYVCNSFGKIYEFRDGRMNKGNSALIFNLNSSLSELINEEFNDSSWFCMDYIDELNHLVFISHDGNICSLNATTLKVSYEGCIDCGIFTSKWKPDQSILLIVTKSNTLLAMTPDLDVVTEVSIVNIAPNTSCILSWMENGQYFSLYNVDGDDDTPKIRIYNNDYTLFAVGRNVGDGPSGMLRGIQPAMSFAPNGSLIAFAQKFDKKMPTITFLEKNGLTHGSLEIQNVISGTTIDPNLCELSSILWNSASSLLLVHIRCKCINDRDFTQIYHRNNYKWYLKLQFAGKPLKLIFDQFDRIYLAAQSLNEQALIRCVDIVWTTNITSTLDASIAIANGFSIHMTPLGKSLIPLPMCKYTHKIDSIPICCHFWEPKNRISDSIFWGLFILKTNNTIDISWGDSNGSITRSSCNIPIILDDINNQHALLYHVRHLSCCHSSNDEIMYVIVAGSIGYDDSEILQIYSLSLNNDDDLISKHANLKLEFTYPIEDGYISCLEKVPNRPSCICYGLINKSMGGSISNYETFMLSWEDVNTNELSIVNDFVSSAPEILYSSQIIEILNREHDDSKYAVIGMSARNRLYCNEYLVESGVSTFQFNNEMRVLLYTTLGTKPLLRFLPCNTLSHLIDNSDADFDDSVLLEYKDLSRPIERGSRIISNVPGTSKVVVELPRGNLECFEPRFLILSRIHHMLMSDSTQMINCLLMMRKQKIDFNFIVDRNPKYFLIHLDGFIQDIVETNSSLLCTFILALNNSNCVEDKYKLPKALNFCDFDDTGESSDDVSVVANEYNHNEKLNVICEKLRKALLQCNSLKVPSKLHILQPILCTFLQQEPPLRVEAINFLRGMNDDNKSDLLTDGLKYMTFLSNHKELFNAALGAFDIPMCRTIASICQMDPRAISPLLNDFESIAGGSLGNYRDVAGILIPTQCFARYRITVYLEAWETSVKWATMYILAICRVELGHQTVTYSTHFEEIRETIKRRGLFSYIFNILEEYTLGQMNRESIVVTSISGQDGDNEEGKCAVEITESLKYTINELKIDYGNYSESQMNYMDAVRLYLSCDPVRVVDAMKAAKLLEDWDLVFSLSYRYVDKLPSPFQPYSLSQELVKLCQATLDDENATDAMKLTTEYNATDVAIAQRAVQSALKHLNDPEVAIGILLKVNFWREAANVSLEFKRIDLLTGDISDCIRSVLNYITVFWKSQTWQLESHVNELKEIWKNPSERLQHIAKSEKSLSTILMANATNNPEEFDDNASEFSALSLNSDASYRSYQSDVSALSSSSRNSTFSSKSEFSVVGLEHSLLSRGSKQKNDKGESSELNPQIKQKRNKYAKGKGCGKDIWGLKEENELCSKLWECITSIAPIANHTVTIVDTILYIGSQELKSQLRELHVSTKVFSSKVNTIDFNALIAPAYPSEWLHKRKMMSVKHFQVSDVHNPSEFFSQLGIGMKKLNTSMDFAFYA